MFVFVIFAFVLCFCVCFVFELTSCAVVYCGAAQVCLFSVLCCVLCCVFVFALCFIRVLFFVFVWFLCYGAARVLRHQQARLRAHLCARAAAPVL